MYICIYIQICIHFIYIHTHTYTTYTHMHAYAIKCVFSARKGPTLPPQLAYAPHFRQVPQRIAMCIYVCKYIHTLSHTLSPSLLHHLNVSHIYAHETNHTYGIWCEQCPSGEYPSPADGACVLVRSRQCAVQCVLVCVHTQTQHNAHTNTTSRVFIYFYGTKLFVYAHSHTIQQCLYFSEFM
jgi:hypothetical protein